MAFLKCSSPQSLVCVHLQNNCADIFILKWKHKSHNPRPTYFFKLVVPRYEQIWERRLLGFLIPETTSRLNLISMGLTWFNKGYIFKKKKKEKTVNGENMVIY